jgi:hypothetical protein
MQHALLHVDTQLRTGGGAAFLDHAPPRGDAMDDHLVTRHTSRASSSSYIVIIVISIVVIIMVK